MSLPHPTGFERAAVRARQHLPYGNNKRLKSLADSTRVGATLPGKVTLRFAVLQVLRVAIGLGRVL